MTFYLLICALFVAMYAATGLFFALMSTFSLRGGDTGAAMFEASISVLLLMPAWAIYTLVF